MDLELYALIDRRLLMASITGFIINSLSGDYVWIDIKAFGPIIHEFQEKRHKLNVYVSQLAMI